MADLKISQLPAAATLDGTELVAVVQSGTTDQTTVAAFTAAAAASGSVVASSDVGTAPNQIPLNQYLGTLAYQDSNAVSISGGVGTFTTLNTTGNTTLGDASTDTVQVNGYMGVGGAPVSTSGLFIASSALTGTTQVGANVQATATSAAISALWATYSAVKTAASAFTMTDGVAFYAPNATKGAGSTITNLHGLYIADQTQGTNNYGITSLVSSGANKWNIYASGTAANYFAGNVGIGTSSPQKQLEVKGSSATSEIRLSNSTAVYSNIYSDSNGILVLTADGGGTGGAASMRMSVAGAERLRIDSSGNVKIGGTADRASTVGTKHLDIFNGTAPVGTLTNGISIYSSAGEAYVMDAAGNATLFSPHDAETNEWIFKSKHTPTGKVLKIDVERLLRFVNDHFGLDAVQEFIEE